MDNPLFLTISELSAGLQRQEFSAVDLTRTALDRLASFGRDYTAVASLLPERGLKEAHAADRMLRDRRDRGTLLASPTAPRISSRPEARRRPGAPPRTPVRSSTTTRPSSSRSGARARCWSPSSR